MPGRLRCRVYFSILKQRDAMPRLRNLDTVPRSSYRYEFQPAHTGDNRNVHIAADLYVCPWFSNRADLENRGRRERLKKYTMGAP